MGIIQLRMGIRSGGDSVGRKRGPMCYVSHRARRGRANVRSVLSNDPGRRAPDGDPQAGILEDREIGTPTLVIPSEAQRSVRGVPPARPAVYQARVRVT